MAIVPGCGGEQGDPAANPRQAGANRAASAMWSLIFAQRSSRCRRSRPAR
jgi:hypothetical protein